MIRNIPAPSIDPIVRAMRIAYLYARMRSVKKCIKYKTEGIAGMHSQIKDDEAQVKAWEADHGRYEREIARLEVTR